MIVAAERIFHPQPMDDVSVFSLQLYNDVKCFMSRFKQFIRHLVCFFSLSVEEPSATHQ